MSDLNQTVEMLEKKLKEENQGSEPKTDQLSLVLEKLSQTIDNQNKQMELMDKFANLFATMSMKTNTKEEQVVGSDIGVEKKENLNEGELIEALEKVNDMGIYDYVKIDDNANEGGII